MTSAEPPPLWAGVLTNPHRSCDPDTEWMLTSASDTSRSKTLCYIAQERLYGPISGGEGAPR
jgi:hypothetical protein